MAILGHEELLEGRSVSGRVREGFTYTRSFLIRTSAKLESMVAVAQATGVKYGSKHPDDPTAYAQSFSVKPHGENPLMHVLEVTYESLKPEEGQDSNDPDAEPNFLAMPRDVWAGGTMTTSVPSLAVAKTPNGPLVRYANSAGTLVEGGAVEQARYTLTLTRSYADLSFMPKLAKYTNSINADAWGGTAARSWLCKGGRWERVIESADGVSLKYYRVTWEFEFRPDTWVLELLSVGFMEKKSGKLQPCLNDDGELVSEPVALDANGARTDGDPAKMTYYPHKEYPFTTEFGAVH